MINGPELIRILDSIARDRKIERSLLIRDLEQAMVSACRKHFNSLDTEEFGCEIDQISGEMTLWRNHEGEERENIPLESLGRIPAQTAKQVMIQRFRDDERASIYDEFSKRVGEIVTGTAQRYEGGSLVVTIDRAEAFMPRSEQIPGEQFNPGDRVRCLILDVRDVGNQVKIVLSRGHHDFIKRLFEIEVPEVSDRTIEVKAMAREAGYRTKMAVASIDSKVDAVGACVGVRGSRIKNIVDELNGEKIDIVRWNESSQILIQNALKPAEVEEISLCFELGRATVVVRDDQLSLAIGKRGQNVRLAARLTGWDIDILTPEEFTKGLEILSSTLLEIEGVEEPMIDRLAVLGMISVFDIEEVGADVLATELEVSESVAQEMVEVCSAKAKVVAEQQQRDKEEAERKRREEEAATASLLGGGDAGDDSGVSVDAILGGGGGDAPAGEAGSDDAGSGESGGEDGETPASSAEEQAEAESRAADILGQPSNG